MFLGRHGSFREQNERALGARERPGCCVRRSGGRAGLEQRHKPIVP